MKKFIVKLVNVIFVVAILLGYNHVIGKKEADFNQKVVKEEKQLKNKYKDKLANASLKNAESKDSNSKSDEGIKYKDGIYQGTGQGFGGDITLSVKINQGKIEKIDIISAKGEDSSYFSRAKELIPIVEEKSSTNVDTISGATFSSKGIIAAVDDALSQAKVQQEECQNQRDDKQEEGNQVKNDQQEEVKNDSKN